MSSTTLTEKKTHDVTNIFIILCSRVISGLGSGIFSFALGLYVLDITGSASKFSMIISFSILPGILVNLFGSVFVDRYNRKKIMIVSDLLSAAAMLIFVFLFRIYPENIVIFIVYVMLLNILGSFFNLAMGASVPNMVNEQNVPKVNSYMQASGALVGIVGPVLGAIAYKFLSMEIIVVIDGTTFLIAGLLAILLYFNHVNVGGQKKKYLEDIILTYKYLNKVRILAFFFVFAAIINFVFNALMFLGLPYINYNVIKVSGIQLSIIQASAAVGAIVGAIIISTRKTVGIFLKRFFLLLAIQSGIIVCWVFPKLPFFQSANKWVITLVFSLLLVSIAMLNTIQNIPMITYFQVKIPEELRGRIIGVFTTAVYISSPLGMWVYGILFEKIDWSITILVSGLIMLILSTFAGKNKYYQEFVRDLKDDM